MKIANDISVRVNRAEERLRKETERPNDLIYVKNVETG
jgi:hypothetical protein